MRDVLDGVFVGVLAGWQEGAAAIGVAEGKAAFGVDVDVAEVDASLGGTVPDSGKGMRKLRKRAPMNITITPMPF